MRVGVGETELVAGRKKKKEEARSEVSKGSGKSK
jgi:hypothetical protein